MSWGCPPPNLGFSSLLFPDLLALPDFFGVACRPSERELGDGHWFLSLVSRYERHRILAWIHRLNGGTAGPWHRRIGRLSGVLENIGEVFPGLPTCFREFNHRLGAGLRPRFRHVAGRRANVPVWLAIILCSPRCHQPGLAFAVVSMDAAWTGNRCRDASRARADHFRNLEAALGLGNIPRPVLQRLLTLLPDRMASVLPGPREAFLDGHNGENWRRCVPHASLVFDHLRANR